MLRKPLTTTHPHKHVITRKDRKLGLLRISKNASTESKVRLDCHDWLPVDEFEGPVVAFLRNPVSRFFSSLPETMLRMTHFVLAEPDRLDRVEVPVDIYDELMTVAEAPVAEVVDLFLELTEYAFFDAHHEPQHAFITDRHMALTADPFLYLTESFEPAISQIEERFSISTLKPRGSGNKGGAKPQRGRTAFIDVARKATHTGVYKKVRHSGFLGQRYSGDTGQIRLRELNDLANRFAREIKTYSLDLPGDIHSRIEELYDLDCRLWRRVTDADGDVKASQVWPKLGATSAGE